MSASAPPSTLPSIRAIDAWRVPATEADQRAAAKFLLAAVEPQSAENAHRIGFIARMLATRDYTRAELAEAMREVPFRNHYGEALRLDVVQQVVDESRQLRARLAQKVTAKERDELLERLAHEGITASHFPCVGYGTGRDAETPLYRFRPEPITPRPAPTPPPAGDGAGPFPFIRE